MNMISVVFSVMMLLYIGSYFLALRILFRYRRVREALVEVCSCRASATGDSVNDAGRSGCEYMLEYFDMRGGRHVAAFERPFGFPKLALFDKIDIYYNPSMPELISVPDVFGYGLFLRMASLVLLAVYIAVGVFVFHFLPGLF